MKWISLKMNMIPLIFQEIDNVTEQYINLLNSIRKINFNENDNNKFEYENNVNEFNELRESITKRINELEDFYENNIEDIRVNNFEKARLRLKKLLMYDVDIINRIEDENYDDDDENISSNEKNKNDKKKIDEAKKRNYQYSNYLKNEKKIKNEKDKNDNVPKLNIPTKKINYSDNNKFVYVKNNKDKIFDNNDFYNFNNNNNNINNKLNFSDKSLDMIDFSKLKEIIFKIKLNPSEYKTLMKEKNKKK
jgi:hypothetical protein